MDPASGTVRTVAPTPAGWAIPLSAGLLGVAGLLQVGASAIRWQPCFVKNGELFGPGFDSRLCLLAGDHSRDYLWVSDPFVPVAGALPLAGMASLLLAAFWILWASLRRDDRFTAIAAGITGASLVFSGGAQLLAGATGGAFGVVPAGVVPTFVFPLVALGPIVASLRLAMLSGRAPNRSPWRSHGQAATWLMLAIAAVVGHPLVDFTLLRGYSGSHDTPVGSGAPGAILLIVTALLFAGVAIGAATASRNGRSRR